MIRKLKIKFVVIIMLILTIIFSSIFAGLYIFQKRQIYNDSIAAMQEAIKNDTKSGLFAEIFGIEAKSSSFPYFNTFVLEVDKVSNTVTAIGFEDELDSETEQYLLKLVHSVPEVNNTDGIIYSENLRYYVNTTARGMKVAYLDMGDEYATLSDLAKNSAWIMAISLLFFFAVSILITKAAIAPAERSWKQQKQLVADVSHELKTPITVISANADIVLSHKDSTVGEQEKWLEYIKQESERMTTLINQMLYLAKNDDGAAKEIMSPVSLSEITESCVLPFESVCFEKGLSLYYDIQPDISIVGSASSLKQLLMILLDNAAKYAGDNGTIRLVLRSDGDKATLSVNNTGEPIPAEKQRHIFERFYRVDQSRAREKGGYGLGLAIAKTIIDSHGARISVTSTAQTGTTFICVFRHCKNSYEDPVQKGPDDDRSVMPQA